MNQEQKFWALSECGIQMRNSFSSALQVLQYGKSQAMDARRGTPNPDLEGKHQDPGRDLIVERELSSWGSPRDGAPWVSGKGVVHANIWRGCLRDQLKLTEVSSHRVEQLEKTKGQHPEKVQFGE